MHEIVLYLTDKYPIVGMPDKVHWNNALKLCYTEKLGYNCIMEAKYKEELEEGQRDLLNRLWKMHIPDKIKAFGWRIFLNKLATKDQLKKGGLCQ